MREEESAGIESIKAIAAEMTEPAQPPTEEEKIAAAQKIAEGIHEPEKGKLEDLKINAVPAPPDDSHLDGGRERPAGKKKTKKARRHMAKADPKKTKKGAPEDGREGEEREPGKTGKPVPPGKKPEPEPEPEDGGWGPLI